MALGSAGLAGVPLLPDRELRPLQEIVISSCRPRAASRIDLKFSAKFLPTHPGKLEEQGSFRHAIRLLGK